MKLALLATLASTATAFLAPTTPIITPQARLSTQIFAEEEAAAEDAPAPRSAEEISALTSSVKTVFSLEDINKILPHRYPFLLVDKVVEYEMGKRAVGVKSVTLNEPHFTGHFPDRPIMPGVLQVKINIEEIGPFPYMSSLIDPFCYASCLIDTFR